MSRARLSAGQEIVAALSPKNPETWYGVFDTFDGGDTLLAVALGEDNATTVHAAFAEADPGGAEHDPHVVLRPIGRVLDVLATVLAADRQVRSLRADVARYIDRVVDSAVDKEHP